MLDSNICYILTLYIILIIITLL